MVAALEGAIRRGEPGFAVCESETIAAEIISDETGGRVAGLLSAALGLGWLTCSQLAEQTGESVREVAERFGLEIERMEERVSQSR